MATVSYPTLKLRCPFDVESLFDGSTRAVVQWTRGQQWSLTRLSALLAAPPNADIAAGQEKAGPMEDKRVVLLPTSTPALAHPLGADVAESGRTLWIELMPDTLRSEFLVGWLNSPLGRECRARAYVRASSEASS